jgi:CheY-like chemotaxis protein
VIEKKLTANLPPIEADPGQVSQVLMNLAVNSRDAMPNGGTLLIETSLVIGEEGVARGLTNGRTGPHILMTVSDTGVGMDEETSSRVFEPFFTTKAVGRGTGLGLSTVYGIVKQSGGNVWVSSEAGKGAKFTIFLPVAEQPTHDVPPSPGQNHMFIGSEKILLVEDEGSVRGLASKILESCGYTVVEASDGEEALVKYDTVVEVDVLITDVVMPRMGGRELSEILTSRSPDLKVLFSSGYTDDATMRLGIGKDGMSFLQKPFTFESLAGKVRTLIDS